MHQNLNRPSQIKWIRLGLLLLAALFTIHSVGSASAQSAETKPMTITVDNRAIDHLINPNVYGVSLADEEQQRLWQLPANRWGGNALTRYNWELDVYNPGNYWYYENTNNPDPGTLPLGSQADQFVWRNKGTETEVVLQLSTIGWTPKDRSESCGFHWDKYDWQTDADWNVRYGCGNGISGATEEPITGNDPRDTSYEVDETYGQRWVQHLVKTHGNAESGGVQYFTLDNEPMIWHYNHRDIFPQYNTFESVRDIAYRYGPAIKAADPTVNVLGPSVWGWTSYTYSALDIETATRDENDEPVYADHEKHGMDFLPWYLKEMKRFEDENGYRIVDYLDFHYYPQGYVDGAPISLQGAGTPDTQAARLRATKDLFDYSYEAESWIATPAAVLPRMHAWVDEHYPGTKLALTEYSWGGIEDINGALAQGDVLGIFGREQVDMAFLWDPPNQGLPGDYAIRMFRNFDGNGGKFGNLSVSAETTDFDAVSVYAAYQSDANHMTVMVINKTGEAVTAPLNFAGDAPLTGEHRYFRYQADDVFSITQDLIYVEGNTLTATYPHNSMTMYVLPMPDMPSSINLTRHGVADALPSPQWALTANMLRTNVAIGLGQ